MRSTPLTKTDVVNSLLTSAGFLIGGLLGYLLVWDIIFKVPSDAQEAALVVVYPLILSMFLGAYLTAYLCCTLVGRFKKQSHIRTTYYKFALFTPFCLPWVIVVGIASSKIILPTAWLSLAGIYLVARHFVVLRFIEQKNLK